jgi:hypothetical protein
MATTTRLSTDDRTGLIGAVADEFRRGFEELTAAAEKDLSGKRFIFNRHGVELYPYFTRSPDDGSVPGCIISIKEGRPVASVDSTCILIGETPEGALYAGRVGLGVSAEGSLRRFYRLGPALVYLSSKGAAGLQIPFSSLELDALLSDHAIAERVIRNTLERKVVDSLLRLEEEMVVMADGSLKHPMGQFASGGRIRGDSPSSLVGFSKSSNMIFAEQSVGELSKASRPAFCKTEDGPVKTFLSKFSKDGLVFRLDVSTSEDPPEKVLGRILYNDAFVSGYPESLRVAHHLSVFSKPEQQALRTYVTRRFSLRRLPTFNLRRATLGTLGGSS